MTMVRISNNSCRILHGANPVFEQIQTEIAHRPQLNNGMLTLDESGDERSGDQSAGTTRQHIGRLGKVDMGQ